MGAQKKWTTLPVPEKKKPNLINETSDNNIIQKAEIEKIKKLLSEKIKDPNLAKKAALIITEMLTPKS